MKSSHVKCALFCVGIAVIIRFLSRAFKKYPTEPTNSAPDRSEEVTVAGDASKPAWLCDTVDYDGAGFAEFELSHERVDGYCTAHFDWSGQDSITLDSKPIKPSDDEAAQKHAEFMLNRMFNSADAPSDRYAHVEVVDKIGILRSSKSYLTDTGGSIGLGEDAVSLSFAPLKAEYNATDAKDAAFWMMPLINCAPTLAHAVPCPVLDAHPLRIQPVESIPSGLSGIELQRAHQHANRHNRLILFKHEETLCYIEPLRDFDQRRQGLLTGSEQRQVTCIMVGEVKGPVSDFDLIKTWLPYDLLGVLGLALGTDVGAPWIEFRNATGELVKRVHVRADVAPFIRGHEIARDDEQRTIALLLTTALASPNFGKSYIRVAMRHFVLSGNSGLTIEDQLSHVFRALDCFCDEFGYTTEHKPVEVLPKQVAHDVTRIIKQAAKDIGALKTAATSNGQTVEAEILDKIVGQVSRAKMTGKGYGKSILALLDKYGFPDAAIIEEYYRTHPRPDNRKWVDVIPRYRGITMHKSFFQFEDGSYDIHDVYIILRHLRDLLLRIILSELGYPGPYQPVVFSELNPASVNWVKPTTPAARLGFGP